METCFIINGKGQLIKNKLNIDFKVLIIIKGGCLRQPTPIFLTGISPGQRSLVGHSPGVSKSQT